MNNHPKDGIRPDQTGGAEIERTPEMIRNGEPTIGTKHAGQEGADYVAHTDSGNNNADTDPDSSR